MEIYKLSPARVAIATSIGEYAEWESSQSSDLVSSLGIILQSDFVNNTAVVTLFSPFALGMYQRTPLNFLTVVTNKSSFFCTTYSSYRAAINGHTKAAKNAIIDAASDPPLTSKSGVCNKCGCVFNSIGKSRTKRCSVCVSKFTSYVDPSSTAEAIHSRLVKFKMSKGCSICGYSKSSAALEFHHTDNKRFHISANDMKKYSVGEVINELSTCVLLCRNCHSEVHNNITPEPAPIGEESTDIVLHLLENTGDQPSVRSKVRANGPRVRPNKQRIQPLSLN